MLLLTHANAHACTSSSFTLQTQPRMAWQCSRHYVLATTHRLLPFTSCSSDGTSWFSFSPASQALSCLRDLAVTGTAVLSGRGLPAGMVIVGSTAHGQTVLEDDMAASPVVACGLSQRLGTLVVGTGAPTHPISLTTQVVWSSLLQPSHAAGQALSSKVGCNLGRCMHHARCRKSACLHTLCVLPCAGPTIHPC